MGAFVDVERGVDAIAISAVALTPAFAALVLSDLISLRRELHGAVALQISSPVASPLDLASAAVDRALCFCC